MTGRADYEFWTLESIERLNAAQRLHREATTAEQRRQALRLSDLAHFSAAAFTGQDVQPACKRW